MSEGIEVHELSHSPTDYWRSWKKTAKVMRLQVSQPSAPPPEDKVRIYQRPDKDGLYKSADLPCGWLYDDIFQLRFVCMSDTHSLTPHLKAPIPDGDVFIHAGDYNEKL